MRLRDLFYWRDRVPENAELRQPLLLSDPPAAGGPRPTRALVLIHGHYWRDGAGHLFDPRERSFLFEPFRRDGRFRLLERMYRVFTYLYPTNAGHEFSATRLAQALRDRLRPAAGQQDVTIVAHSMGGLVARYAMQQAGLGQRVRSLITLATPHHGTILASLIMAHAAVRRKIGLLPWFLQRMGRRIFNPTPGMAGMASDNVDGRLDPVEEDRYGIAINRDLARLNEEDPHLGRIVCVMGRVRGWWLRGRTLWDQIPRWLLSRWDPSFVGLDPLVPLESGLATGLPVAARLMLDGLDHESIVTHPRTHDLLYQMLLSRPARARSPGAK
ncbi:MAG: alpha/beta fold hydrolase [Candidatus Riflebacteria bacterium]|nr:alpha/beta fold hydrolase [Candidatus Riflebacteria bacterium]